MCLKKCRQVKKKTPYAFNEYTYTHIDEKKWI